MRYELKSIGIWAFTKVAFFLNLIIGFVFGLFYALFLGIFFSIMESLPLMPGGDFGDSPDVSVGVLLIILPIMFAIGGAIIYTIFGIIFVVAYNLVARMTGGFEMELALVAAVSPPQPIGAQTQIPQADPPPLPPVTPPAPVVAPPPPPVQPPTPEAEDRKNDDKFKPPDYLDNK